MATFKFENNDKINETISNAASVEVMAMRYMYLYST